MNMAWFYYNSPLYDIMQLALGWYNTEIDLWGFVTTPWQISMYGLFAYCIVDFIHHYFE